MRVIGLANLGVLCGLVHKTIVLFTRPAIS